MGNLFIISWKNWCKFLPFNVMTVIVCMDLLYHLHCVTCATSNINAGKGSFFFFLKSGFLVFSNDFEIISPLMGRLTFQVIGLSCFRSRTERCGEGFQARPGEGLCVDVSHVSSNIQWKVGGGLHCLNYLHLSRFGWKACTSLPSSSRSFCCSSPSFMTSCGFSLYPINYLFS